jgi:hypothetical protein
VLFKPTFTTNYQCRRQWSHCCNSSLIGTINKHQKGTSDRKATVNTCHRTSLINSYRSLLLEERCREFLRRNSAGHYASDRSYRIDRSYKLRPKPMATSINNAIDPPPQHTLLTGYGRLRSIRTNRYDANNQTTKWLTE